MCGVTTEDDVAAGRCRIIAPEHFLREAIAENVIAGFAMARRALYQFGPLLPAGPRQHVDCGTTGSYGHLAHNVKAVYQRYLSWLTAPGEPLEAPTDRRGRAVRRPCWRRRRRARQGAHRLRPGDAGRQATHCLDDLAILRGVHGFDRSHVRRTVVDVTSGELANAWRSGREHFDGEVPPTTLLGVERLGHDGRLVEIDATARR